MGTPGDLASTSLWPLMVRLSSMQQPLGNRGISPIYSSGRAKVLGVEGSSESATIFTGRLWPPPGPGLTLRPRGGKIHQIALTYPVVVDPLLIVIFWCFSVIPPHILVQPLLRIAAFLINYLTKRSYYHNTLPLFLSQHNGVFHSNLNWLLCFGVFL